MTVSVSSAGYLGNRVDAKVHEPSALLFLWIAQSRTHIEPAWDRSPIIRKTFQVTMVRGCDRTIKQWVGHRVWTLVKLSPSRSAPSIWPNGRIKCCRVDWKGKNLFPVYLRSLQWDYGINVQGDATSEGILALLEWPGGVRYRRSTWARAACPLTWGWRQRVNRALQALE